MPYCAICRKSIIGEIKVFRVPKDLDKRKLWEESMGMTFNENCRICENHFESSDWKWKTNRNKEAKRRLLMPNAIPKKIVICNENLEKGQSQAETQCRMGESSCIINTNVKFQTAGQKTDQNSERIIVAPNILGNVDIVSVPDFVSATGNVLVPFTGTSIENDPLAEEKSEVHLLTKTKSAENFDQTKCRTCCQAFDVDEHAKDLADPKNDELLYQIAVITGIWIQCQDGMTPFMCSICAADLRTAYDFRETCIQTEKQLRGEDSVPISTVIKEDDTEFDNSQDEEAQSFSDNDVHEGNILESFGDNDVHSCIGNFLAHEKEQQTAQTTNVEPWTCTTTLQTAETSCQLATDPKGFALHPVTKSAKSRKQKTRELKPKQPKRSLEEKNRIRREQIKAMPLNHVCDECGAAFRLSWNLSMHMLRHKSKKNFKCPECPKEFYDAYLRNIHVRVRHKGELPFSCNFCNKSFNASSTRYMHEKKIHGAYPRVEKKGKTQKKPQTDVRFFCTYCDKSYATKNALNGHINVHTGATPFKCKLCDLSFANPQLKKRHEIKHSDKRPFECDICLKGFYDRSKLKEHSLIHTGERPYRCDVCDAHFRYKFNLYSHQFSKMHKENLQKAQKDETVEDSS